LVYFSLFDNERVKPERKVYIQAAYVDNSPQNWENLSVFGCV